LPLNRRPRRGLKLKGVKALQLHTPSGGLVFLPNRQIQLKWGIPLRRPVQKNLRTRWRRKNLLHKRLLLCRHRGYAVCFRKGRRGGEEGRVVKVLRGGTFVELEEDEGAKCTNSEGRACPDGESHEPYVLPQGRSLATRTNKGEGGTRIASLRYIRRRTAKAIGRTAQVLRRTAQVLRRTAQVLRWTAQVLRRTAEVLRWTAQVLRWTAEVLGWAAQVLRWTAEVLGGIERRG